MTTLHVIHSRAEARAALDLARSSQAALILESPPSAAGQYGVGWWLALVEPLAKDFPDVTFEAVLDCGAAPGFALEALRAGVPWVRLDAPAAVMAALTDIAAGLGGRISGPAPSPREEGQVEGKGRPAGLTSPG